MGIKIDPMQELDNFVTEAISKVESFSEFEFEVERLCAAARIPPERYWTWYMGQQNSFDAMQLKFAFVRNRHIYGV